MVFIDGQPDGGVVDMENVAILPFARKCQENKLLVIPGASSEVHEILSRLPKSCGDFIHTTILSILNLLHMIEKTEPLL
jgi:hypothetical protein